MLELLLQNLDIGLRLAGGLLVRQKGPGLMTVSLRAKLMRPALETPVVLGYG